MKKVYGILLFVCLAATQVFASHILGGEITYRYLGSNGPADRPFRYQIRFVGYVDRVGAPGDLSNWGCGNLGADPLLSIYDAGTNEPIPRIADAQPNQIFLVNWPLPSHGDQVQGTCDIDPYFGSVRPVIIKKPASCVVPGLDELSIAITDTTFIVELPFSASGYKVTYANCCRSSATTNIDFGAPGPQDDPGNTWLAEIPSPIFVNSSPQFLEDAVPFFCRGDTATIANNASDPDGDKLIYSFIEPYSGEGGNPPNTFTFPTNSFFGTGFSVNQPFGATGYAFINPSTGLTKYYSTINGNFAVAIQIQEYRTLSNGTEILISTTRREFLIVVKDCAPNPGPTPVPPPEFSAGGTLTVTEGDSVKFNITSNDLDTTSISVISDLVSGTNGYTGSLATAPSVTGTGLVATPFRWKADCGLTKGQTRSYPVNVKFVDRGCPPKETNVIYTIIVNPFKAPVITGKDSICSTDQLVSYSAPAGTGRQWKVVGGSITGSSTGNTVNFSFPGDTALIRLVVTSGQGCKDSTSRKVTKVQFLPIVASAPSPFVCQDSTIRFNATGGYNTVSWLPATGLSSGIVRNPLVTIGDTASYVVTSNGPGGCIAKDTIEVKWVPRIANAGADSILCSGSTRGIGGLQPTGYAYYKYEWTPSTGVISDTSFKTGVELSNTGSSAQIFTFTQRATHRASSCTSTDTVRILVKPLPLVNAGPDTTVICSGAKALIGTLDPSLATFSWSPPFGLTSPGKDTTTVSLVNDSIFAETTKYFLTKTELLLNPAPGEPACINADSIVVKINPLPEFPLSSNDSICSGFATQIGTPTVSGFSYSWSPTRGLSHADSSITSISLTNLSQNPGDTLYTLTVTNTATTCLKNKDLSFRVNPLPLISAGIDTAFCSGDTIRIGELEQAGFSYGWTPATGLVSSVSGNPKISLINPATGGSNQVFQYKVLKTNNRTSCRNADSVLVAVKPLPIANAALTDSLVVCSESSLQLGEPGLANHLYTWVPDSALTASNVSNPVLNVTNPTQLANILKYTVRVVNSISTCRNSDSVYVKINPLPIVPLAYIDTSVCSGDTIFIGGASVTGYSYAWSPKVQLSDSTLSITGFSAVNPTTVPASYLLNLQVTINSTTCQNNKALTVRVNPLPTADAGLDKSFCSRDTIQIGLPPVNPGWKYNWTPASGILNPNLANPFVTLLNEGTLNSSQVYLLTVTDTLFGTRCAVQDNVELTVKPLPQAVASIPTDTLTTCSTVGIQLGVAPNPALSYNWLPSGGLSNGSLANPVATLTTTGSPVYRKFILSVNDPVSTCSNSDSAWILVNPLPIVNVGATDSLCSGDTIVIGPGPVVQPYTYLWTPSAGLSGATGANASLTLVNPTGIVSINPYQLLVTDIATGCTDSATLNVRVNPLPTVDAGLDKAICSGETVPVGFNNEAVGLNFNWLANPGLNFTNISNPSFTATTLAPKKDTLFLTATNVTTQCKRTDFAVITTNPRPVPMVFGPFSNTVCPFTPNIPYSVINSVAGNTYAWSVSGGTQVSGGSTNAITVTWDGPNPGARIFAVPTNEFGCVGSKDSISVTLNQNLQPVKPFGDSVLCSYQRLGNIYSTIPTPGSNYTWKLVNATVDSTTSNNGQTTVDWNITDGIAKIWIQQQSSTIDPITNTPVQCYGRSDTLLVRINPSPDSTLNINGLSSFCSGPEVTGSFNLNGSPTSSYQWTVVPDASFASPNGNDTISVRWINPGSYSLSVQETSDKGCAGRIRTQSIQVNPPPRPSFLASGSICPNSLVNSYAAVPTPGFENSTFNWLISGADSISGANEKLVTIKWNNGGVYALVLRETSALGCIKDTAVELKYDPSAVELKNVSLLEVDENQVALSFGMTSQETNPSQISIWRRDISSANPIWSTVASNIEKNITTYLDQVPSSSSSVYQYEIRSTNSCLQRIASNVHNTILLKAEPSQQDETVKLNWNGYEGWASGVGNYSMLRRIDQEATLLEFDGNIPNTTSLERVYKVAGDGFNQCYRVVAKDGSGNLQALSNTVCVKFDNPLVFFNMFTPNGDGRNDGWDIKNLKLYPENKLEIYDRWGKKVFQESNYGTGNLWEAKDIADGVYFYKFSVPDRSLDYNGWIQIAR